MRGKFAAGDNNLRLSESWEPNTGSQNSRILKETRIYKSSRSLLSRDGNTIESGKKRFSEKRNKKCCIF